MQARGKQEKVELKSEGIQMKPRGFRERNQETKAKSLHSQLCQRKTEELKQKEPKQEKLILGKN